MSKKTILSALTIFIVCIGVLTVSIQTGIPESFWETKNQGEHVIQQSKKEEAHSTPTTTQKSQTNEKGDHTQTQSISGISGPQVSTPTKDVPPGYSSELIDIKFREGTDVSLPEELLPLDLRDSVSRINRVSTLSDEELERMGADRFKLWFRITLQPETDVASFIESLESLTLTRMCCTVLYWYRATGQ